MKRDLGFLINRFRRWLNAIIPSRVSCDTSSVVANVSLDFVKLCGEWYADVPNWKGDLHNLTMVMGADKLLDYLSGNTKFVSLCITRTDNGGVRLEKIQDIYDGADYKVCDDNCPVREIWLCQVNNLFWGGDAPDVIYFRINYDHPNVNKTVKLLTV